jgi:hypothetical protein
MLRRPVGLDQANVEIERALRDRRAKIDGQRQRIARSLRMIDQRPQNGGGGGAAERADEGPVIVAGLPLPAAVTGGHPRGFVEKVRSLGQHESPRIVIGCIVPSWRHCYFPAQYPG